MRNGLSAGPLPSGIFLPFRDEVERAAEKANFSPLVAYAIKVNESGRSTDPCVVQAGGHPTTLLMPDGSNAGVGIFQLTSFRPENWRDPYENALCAITHEGWMLDAEEHWVKHNAFQGERLVRAIASSFNAGIGGAELGHSEGDLDRYTTARYGERALLAYQKLLAGESPFS